MLKPLRAIAVDPMLSLVALAILCFGALVASVAPHQSLVAIRIFGFSDASYSAIMAAGSALSVAASIWIGILTDQRADRRIVAAACAGLGATGGALVFVVASPMAYLVAHVLIFPFSATLFGQIFALARLATTARPAGERDGIMATIRALFAVPFVLVLPLWSLAFSLGTGLLAIYAVIALASAVILVLLLTRWPATGATTWHDPKSGIRFGAALAELTSGRIMVRMAALAAVQAGVSLYMAVLGLILTSTGRGTSDVALFAGLVAGLEVPLMLALPLLLARVSKTVVLAWAALIHAGFLGSFPLVAPYSAVWLMVLPAAIGAAVILTVPIAYLQDLMSDRPGAGGALIAVQGVTAQVIAAAVFAVGSGLSGYGTAALLGAVLAAFSGLALLMMDRGKLA